MIGACSVHRYISVTFQQAHHSHDLIQHLPLLRRRHQHGDAPFGERIAPFSAGCRYLVDSSGEGFRVGVHRIQRLIHEREKVLTQPSHSRELRSVRYFVEGDPETELVGREAVPPFQCGDVGGHIVDNILSVFLQRSFFVFDHQQVVLPQHPSRHPAQHCAYF